MRRSRARRSPCESSVRRALERHSRSSATPARCSSAANADRMAAPDVHKLVEGIERACAEAKPARERQAAAARDAGGTQRPHIAATLMSLLVSASQRAVHPDRSIRL